MIKNSNLKKLNLDITKVADLILYQRNQSPRPTDRPVVLLSTKTGRQVAPDRQMAPPTSPARLLLNRELAPTRGNSRQLAPTCANLRKLAQTRTNSRKPAQTRTNLRKVAQTRAKMLGVGRVGPGGSWAGWAGRWYGLGLAGQRWAGLGGC